MSKRDSAEYRAFRKCFSVLADGITDPGRLAVQLFSKELIGRHLRKETQKQAIEKRDKIVMLLSAVEDQIEANPATKFREFLDVLHNEPSLQHLATRLEDTHRELSGTPSVLPNTSTPALSPLTVCTQPTTPIPIPSRCPQHSPHNSHQPLTPDENTSSPPSQHFTPSSPPINTSETRLQTEMASNHSNGR